MNPFMAIKVMELEIQGLPAPFDDKQLQQRARAVVSDLARLLEMDRLLQYTTLTYRYRLHSKDAGTPLILLVLELTPRPQRLLDFLPDHASLGTLEK